MHADTVCRNVKHLPLVPLAGTQPDGCLATGERDSLSFNSRRTLTVHINIYCKEGMRCVCSSETPRTAGTAAAHLGMLLIEFPTSQTSGGVFFVSYFRPLVVALLEKKMLRMQLCHIPFDSCNINTYFFFPG